MSGRIQIESQRAQIEITSRRAQLQITNPPPRMRIKRIAPKMSIERKMPTFRVNWKRVREESGLALPLPLALQRRDRARQLTSEAINRIAKDGNQMSNIHLNVNMVAEIARQHSLESDNVQVNLGSMPQSLPDITWDPGSLIVDWSVGEMQIEWDISNRPEITIEPHSVEIRMRNYPGIKITFVADEAKKVAGRKVDKKI